MVSTPLFTCFQFSHQNVFLSFAIPFFFYSFALLCLIKVQCSAHPSFEVCRTILLTFHCGQMLAVGAAIYYLYVILIFLLRSVRCGVHNQKVKVLGV